MAYYPIFLALEGRPCLVVGGGAVATQKVRSLIRCGAKVTVVAPRLSAVGLKRWVKQGKIRWRAGRFGDSDMKGVELIIAATDEQPVNERACQLARQRGCWINVVDQPRLCSFIVPSVVRRGKLTLAISTGGVSPALAKWIRKDLEHRYGPQFRRLLNAMARERPKVLRRLPQARSRKRLFEKALRAYLQVLKS